jgi:fructose-bisphosphate aldolase class II
MGLCPLKQLLLDAQTDGRALGAFNVASLEMLLGIVAAAEESGAPIALQIAEKRLSHSPLHIVGPMLVAAARSAKVDIAVQLDHGESPEIIRQAVELGFSSIMFDGSNLPLRENIRRTAKLAAFLSAKGISLEAEIGVLGGSEGGAEKQAIHADPQQAALMAEESGCDALAVGIGNAHGHYRGKPQLNFAVLEQIRALTDIPLVLHGGTGIEPEDFRKAVLLGIRKINIATANFDAAVSGALECFNRLEAPDYFNLNESMVESVRRTTLEHLQIFNSSKKVSS